MLIYIAHRMVDTSNAFGTLMMIDLPTSSWLLTIYWLVICNLSPSLAAGKSGKHSVESRQYRQAEMVADALSLLISWYVLVVLLGTNVYEVDNATHTYTALGTYTISCVAINSIGNTTLQYVVVVQVPVSDQFIVNSSSPTDFTTGNLRRTHVSVVAIHHIPKDAHTRYIVVLTNVDRSQ